jgi:hypothetical protein
MWGLRGSSLAVCRGCEFWGEPAQAPPNAAGSGAHGLRGEAEPSQLCTRCWGPMVLQQGTPDALCPRCGHRAESGAPLNAGLPVARRESAARPSSAPRTYVRSLVSDEEFFCAPALSSIHTANARLYPSREAMLAGLPQGARVAEVGTQTGQFAASILEATQPRELHLIDLSYRLFRRGLLTRGIESGVVSLHEGDSTELLSRFPDCYFDWIYLDGDHSYAGVTRDAEMATRKLSTDGILIFNGYTPFSPLELCQYGVMRAVNELCLSDNFEVVYLALHPLGYHDVALRRLPGQEPA